MREPEQERPAAGEEGGFSRDPLSERARQLQAVSELGFVALAHPVFREFTGRAARVVAEALDVDVVTIDELLDDGGLLSRDGVGLGGAGEAGERVESGTESLAAYTIARATPVITGDMIEDPRFDVRRSFREAGLRSAVSVAVGPERNPWGILIGATRRPRTFTGDDVSFMRSVANLLEAVRRAEETERELQRLADALEQASDAIISIDSTYAIRRWNLGAESVFELAASDAVGRTIDQINLATRQPEEVSAQIKEAVRTVLATGRGYHYDTQRHHGDGQVLDLAVDVTPWRINGRTEGVTAVLRDITTRKQAEQAQARLAAIVDASDDAIIGKTLAGEITSWNPAAERIYGYSAEEAVGRDISLVVPAARREELGQIMASVQRGVPVTRLETERLSRDGRAIEVSVSVSPVRDADGRLVGAATVAREIGERREAERAREEMLQSLADSQRLAMLGSWTWAPRTTQITWSAQMYAIFDRDPSDGPIGGEELMALIHPDDRQLLTDVHAEATAGRRLLEVDCRLLRPAGVIRHVHVLAYADPHRPNRYLGTVQDVTEQRRAEQERAELLSARVRAESANRAKSDFLARMSHELRTPLNSIMGFAQLLELEGLEPHQQQSLDLVLRAARHLLELINEVLDLARVESGRLSVSPEAVELESAVREAVELVAPLAAERGVGLRVDPSGLSGHRYVNADRNRLNQVLLNLLSNAIKYNRPRGHVEVAFEVTPERMRLLVADDGIGIPGEQLSKLFEPFERLGAEQTEVEGTGLGLALSKALLEAMQGSISAVSRGGEGSTFTVELQRSEPPEMAPGDHPPQAPLAPASGVPTRVVLYIEDNIANLTLVDQILQRYFPGRLISAIQGRLGLDLAREHRPDLVLLDVHLPDMSGFDVLQQLRADESTRGIPVVMLTADGNAGRAADAQRLGADAFLTKPIDVRSFIDVVGRHLGRGAT